MFFLIPEVLFFGQMELENNCWVFEKCLCAWNLSTSPGDDG